MKEQKVLVRGFVKAPLKQWFVEELRRENEKNGLFATKDKKITQSKFLQTLLNEAIASRKKTFPRIRRSTTFQPNGL